MADSLSHPKINKMDVGANFPTYSLGQKNNPVKQAFFTLIYHYFSWTLYKKSSMKTTPNVIA